MTAAGVAPRAERPRGERGERGFRSRPSSQGSGFFVSADGYLVTNNHVVAGGQTFMIGLDDGTGISRHGLSAPTSARTSPSSRVEDADREFTYVGFADDNGVRVGDWVVAVGNPFGLGGTVTAGHRLGYAAATSAPGCMTTSSRSTPAVNRGNSGGPAFNLNGEVVGVNTAIFSPSGGNVGIAFAIPASLAGDVVTNLIERGAGHARLAGRPDPAGDRRHRRFGGGLAAAEGALVTEAQARGSGRPPARQGVRAGDIITEINDQTVDFSTRTGPASSAASHPVRAVDVTLWRNGAERVISVDLGELPGMEAAGKRQASDGARGR